MSKHSTKDFQEALDIVRQYMKDNNPSHKGSVAHSWHCNIAMKCYDSIMASDLQYLEIMKVGHAEAIEISNDAAREFMKLAFHVRTSK